MFYGFLFLGAFFLTFFIDDFFSFYKQNIFIFLKEDCLNKILVFHRENGFLILGVLLVFIFISLLIVKYLIFWFKKRKRNNFFSKIKTLDDMFDKLSNYTFEDYVAYFYSKQGFKAIRTGVGTKTKKNKKDGIYGDGGKDVILSKKYRKDIIVQCKFYSPSNVISVKTVREMIGVLVHYKVRKVIIVTTSSFSADAIKFAKGKKIELIDGNELVKRISKIKHF